MVPGGQAGGNAQEGNPRPTRGGEVGQADRDVPQGRLQGADAEGGGGRHDGPRKRRHQGDLADLEGATHDGGRYNRQTMLRREEGSLRLPGFVGRVHSCQQRSHPAP